MFLSMKDYNSIVYVLTRNMIYVCLISLKNNMNLKKKKKAEKCEGWHSGKYRFSLQQWEFILHAGVLITAIYFPSL